MLQILAKIFVHSKLAPFHLQSNKHRLNRLNKSRFCYFFERGGEMRKYPRNNKHYNLIHSKNTIMNFNPTRYLLFDIFRWKRRRIFALPSKGLCAPEVEILI